MRLVLPVLLWGLASAGSADVLASGLRGCVDRFDPASQAEISSIPARDEGRAGGEKSAGIHAEGSSVSPIIRLASDCPEVLKLLPHPALTGLMIEYRSMTANDWRALAHSLEGHGVAVAGLVEVVGLDPVLAELDPAPLAGVADQRLWRARLWAWGMHQLRRLFGSDTVLGRWLQEVMPDAMQTFADGMLAFVLLMFAFLAAIFGVLCYRFLSERRRRAAPHRRYEELPGSLAATPLLPAARIRTLPGAQQPLALMRLVLEQINELGLCTIHGSMTNSEVAGALVAAAELRIDKLVDLADRCLFSGHAATESELVLCWAEVDALKGRLGSLGEKDG